MRAEDAFFWMVWITFIGGGVLIIIAAMIRRFKIVEMHHKERIAMIERGLTPPGDGPDARGQAYVVHERDPSLARSRMLSAGIFIIGLGLAIMAVIGIAVREPNIAVGIGGAVAIIGVAFVVIAFFQSPPPSATRVELSSTRPPGDRNPGRDAGL